MYYTYYCSTVVLDLLDLLVVVPTSSVRRRKRRSLSRIALWSSNDAAIANDDGHDGYRRDADAAAGGGGRIGRGWERRAGGELFGRDCDPLLR